MSQPVEFETEGAEPNLAEVCQRGCALGGWIDRPDWVQQNVTALNRQSGVICADRPDLHGFWQRQVARGITAILPFQCEMRVWGHYLPAHTQQRGTCVGQAIARALQDSLYYGLHRGGVIGRVIRVAFEPIYAGARTHIRRQSLGQGDGAIVADAARFVHDYGILARGVYGDFDLTQPREDLAVFWGSSGQHVPAPLVYAAAEHPGTVYWCPTFEDACDCLAAGYCVAIGCSRVHTPLRDAQGMCRFYSTAAHCLELCGVFLLPSWNGRAETVWQHTGLVVQQSWGDYPRGPDRLVTFRDTIALRQGAYGITADEARAMFHSSADVWAFSWKEPYR